MKVLFMGTPQFAQASLEAIINSGYQVPAVITVPDKPAGRGQKIQYSDVKKYALEKQIPIFQPENLRDPDFLNEIKSIKPDIAVVVAFRKLPKELWSLPSHGTFNLHASLLPQYRGAAPINRAVMNGESQSGVTTFFIDDNIDTGNVLFKETVAISYDDDAGTLHDKLMNVGSGLVLKTIEAIITGDCRITEQRSLLKEGEQLKPAPKIFKEDCRINWDKPAVEVYNHIRGLSPFPTAFCELSDKTLKENILLKVFKASIEEDLQGEKPGSISTDLKNYFKVSCSDRWICLKEVQAPGKKKMKIDEFLRGFRQ
ncbi:MAG: methionyl-tRNA formyltransferase [Bacteroidales bacterium]|nr:methionyl-tRNA formyltransferase [Bacteroidales bacterium]